MRFLYGDVYCFGECTNSNKEPSSTEAEVANAVCIFLHVSITMIPLENVMTGLAYATELVPTLCAIEFKGDSLVAWHWVLSALWC